MDFNTYYEVASTIHQNVQNSSRQMDFGRFQRCQIEGPFGCIHIMASKKIVYASFGSKNAKSDQIQKHLHRLIGNINT